MSQIPWLNPSSLHFPPVDAALKEPNGLLAAGGDLSVPRLLAAYRQGIFPWYEAGQPLLWWSPDPRAVLFSEKLHIARSLRKQLKRQSYHCLADTAFAEVMAACAKLSQSRPGTWITPEMRSAYQSMFEAGWAHSIEVWQDGELIGGLYGIAMGEIFFGESMFSRRPNASKIALIALCALLKDKSIKLIDCQVGNPYLFSMGAEEIPRARLQHYLDRYANAEKSTPQRWQLDWHNDSNDAKLLP